MKKALSYLLITILTVTFTLPVVAASQSTKSINEQKKQIKEEQKKIEENKSHIDDIQAKENQEYQQILEDMKLVDQEYSLSDEAYNHAVTSYEDRRKAFKTRLKVMYEDMNMSIVETLIESKNIVDFFQKMHIISQVAKKDRQSVDELKAAKEEVEFKRKLIEERQLALRDLTNEKRSSIDKLKTSRASLDEQYRKNKAKLEQLEKQEDSFIKESENSGKAIKNLQKSGKYAGGSMVWPVPSSRKIDSYFGMRIHPVYKKKKMHYGVDIDGKRGASIVAVNSGRVIMSGYSSGYGNRVVIDHGGGITTLYAHCQKLLVSVGQKVSSGQVIAKVGSTGVATGPHLHFEVRNNGNIQNPLNYIGR